jgi:tetrahydromethanopterin S-methyltransferase subunit G
MTNYNGIDRRKPLPFEHCPKFDKHELSEEQIVEIAKKAVELAATEFYQQVGKTITQKFFMLVGIITIGALGWLGLHGGLK